MSNLFNQFWKNYEKRFQLYAGITTGLFLLQIVHLFWLTTHVVAFRLFNKSLFDPSNFWQLVIIFVDYTEVPAIVTTSILYVHSLRQKFNYKDLILLILINSQWLHLFWITDEFVLNVIHGNNPATILPFWLAWIAILIDYLEIPVMYDTIKKFLRSLKTKPRFDPKSV
ncbi:MAG: hypothetical protein HYZ51_04190 [Candidatus Doudnabacteria bacterium]|nr:hypothetical protein [Candidatus Doudnabacteria bacterium]